MSDIKKNILSFKKKLTPSFCPNYPVKLLAVSKSQSSEKILTAYNAGQKIFGENYLQEALEKIKVINKSDIEWHFIGPIQSNKCKLIAENFSWVQSIDRIKIALKINEYRDKLTPINICVQINISQEESKGGVHPNDLIPFINDLKSCENLKLRGLMSIPSNTISLEKLSAEFITLSKLYEEIKEINPAIDTLSMGMSNDYLMAIKYGANLIRIGSAIFGSRNNNEN